MRTLKLYLKLTQSANNNSHNPLALPDCFFTPCQFVRLTLFFSLTGSIESINSMATVVIMEVEATTAEDMVDTVMVDVSHYRLPSMKIMLLYCFSSPEYFVHRRSRLLRRILLDYGM